MKTDSADGQDALVRHFDAGAGSPAVVVADSIKRDQVLAAVRSEDGVVFRRSSSPVTTRWWRSTAG